MRLRPLLLALCCTPLVASAQFGEYPDEVSELAYFASGLEWGDPNNQHRFAMIEVMAGDYISQNGTYDSLQDLLTTESLSELEGIAIECRECAPFSGGNDLQREIEGVLLANGIDDFLIWPSSEWSQARQIFLDRTTGKFVGTVTSAETGEPLRNAFVSSEFFGDTTDENGEFEVIYLDPGTVHLVASRRDRESVEVDIEIVAGETIRHDFALPEARPACCRLEGEWEIELTVTDDRRPSDQRLLICAPD